MSEMKFELKGVNGQLYVYEDRIVIERKGAFGFLTQGFSGSKTIPMTAIQTVQFKEGNAFINGFIQFGIMGGHEKQGGAFNAAQDENSVMLKASSNELGKDIKDYIENIIMTSVKPQATTNVQQVSVADEIIKLKELLDSGILTQEEFNAKKKQLLAI